MELQGTLYRIFDINEVKAGFRKREFVLKHVENPVYPQYIKFELTQDRCDLIEKEGVTEGDEIEVIFAIDGREWTNPKGEVVYFNSLRAYQIRKAAGSSVGKNISGKNMNQQSAVKNVHQQPTTTAHAESTNVPVNMSGGTEQPEDDLPF
jgi:hypothetical protein